MNTVANITKHYPNLSVLDALISWFTIGDVINPADVRTVGKLYAEWYARKCLLVAAEEATTINSGSCSAEGSWVDYMEVDKSSILLITLPKHT